MLHTELTILGLDDEHALRLAMNAIQDLPGIGHVEVDGVGRASIEHSRMVTPDDLAQALRDAGFEVRAPD